jgi:thimet oligopeptidase
MSSRESRRTFPVSSRERHLLGCEAGARYRKTVLEQGGSKPGKEMVRDFLGRDEEFAAFGKWLNEEFEEPEQPPSI